MKQFEEKMVHKQIRTLHHKLLECTEHHKLRSNTVSESGYFMKLCSV